MQRIPDKRPSFNELVFRTRAGSEAVSAAGSAQHGHEHARGLQVQPTRSIGPVRVGFTTNPTMNITNPPLRDGVGASVAAGGGGTADSGGVGNGGDSVAIAVVAGGGAVAAAADVKQQSINAGFEEDV